MDVLALIVLVLKFAVMIFEKTSKTPMEKRGAAMAELDAALTKAKTTKDLSELSRLMGRGL